MQLGFLRLNSPPDCLAYFLVFANATGFRHLQMATKGSPLESTTEREVRFQLL